MLNSTKFNYKRTVHYFFYIKFQIAPCLKLLHNNAIIKLKTTAAAVIYAFTDSVDNI